MDDTQQSRASDAAATRKRRSSILKSQRPARTPFSELEFNVATPTDTAKSRRVSFSRRTGVAEFVTNEATTTWKNFYEEHNKSLESSGNDSEATASRQPVGHLGKRLFDQQFEEVEAIEFVGSLNPNLGNGSMNNVNFSQQLAPLEVTEDGKLTAPLNKFELSVFTEQQSKLFGNDFTAPSMCENSGRIDVNFSAIQPMGAIDDLDEIQKDLERVSNNQMGCHNAFTDRRDVSEYIEVDLNMTHVGDKNDEDMSITDTVHSPVHDVSKSASIDKKVSLSTDWVADKENIAINPYAAPRESINFAVNDEPDQVLVFDGKRLTLQPDKPEKETNYRKTLLPNSSTETHQRKTIVLNVHDDLPNFGDDMRKSKCENIGFSFAQELRTSEDEISDTLPVNRVDIVPKRKTMHDKTGNISITQALPTNIICHTAMITNDMSSKRRTIVFDQSAGNISVTQSLPAQILNDIDNRTSELRRTVVYENDTGNISITQAVPTNILVSEKNDKRKTIVFDDDLCNLSVTQAVPTNIIDDKEKRKTIVFNDDAGNVSITQALPANIMLPDKQKQEKRRTIIYEDDSGNISVTQAIPSNVILSHKSEPITDRRRTVVYEDETGNISVTQALPSNIILETVELNDKTKAKPGGVPTTQSLPTNISQKECEFNRRRTIVYENDTGNISITQAIPTQFLPGYSNENVKSTHSYETAKTERSNENSDASLNISPRKPNSHKRQTIVYDNDDNDISMTEAIPANIIASSQANEKEKRKTIVFDEDEANISMTLAISTNIFLLDKLASDVSQNIKIPETVAEVDEKVIDYEIYEEEPPPVDAIKENQETVLNTDNDAEMSIAEDTPKLQNLLQESEKLKSVIFDKDTANISMTKPIPPELTIIQNELIDKSKNNELDMTEQELVANLSPDVIVYQAATTKSLQKMPSFVSEQTDLKGKPMDLNIEAKEASSAKVSEDVDISYHEEDSVDVSLIHPRVDEKKEQLDLKTIGVGSPTLVADVIETQTNVDNDDELIEKQNDSVLNTLLDMSSTTLESADGTEDKNLMVELESPPSSSTAKNKGDSDCTSSESMFYITKDSENDTQTEVEKSDKPSPTKRRSKLALEYTEDENLDVLQQKLEALKTAVTDETENPSNRLYENVVSSNLEDVVERDENVKLRQQSNTFKKANDTKELLEMISDFTDHKEEEEAPLAIKIKGHMAIEDKSDEQNRHSFVPSRQSIALSREELMNNISMAQAALQRSRLVLNDSECMEEDTKDESMEQDLSKKSNRMSNDVVKTLQFDDESMSETNAQKSDIKFSPLKKTAFGETSYMTEPKAKVIPTYLKSVSDGIKELMLDLVKPMTDTMPFDSGTIDKSVRRAPSTQSTQIQANLTTTSQVDIESESYINIGSHYDIDKMSSVTGALHKSSRCFRSPAKFSTSSEKSSEFEVPSPRQRYMYSRVHLEESAPPVLLFDHLNPLNNILLGTIDYSDAHKYNPKRSEHAIGDPASSNLKHDKTKNEKEHEGGKVSKQYRVETKPRITQGGVCSFKQEDLQSVLSTSSRPPSIDQSIDTQLSELKDNQVNTLIAMKGNRELLEASSSLTLVDDAIATHSEGELTSRTTSQEAQDAAQEESGLESHHEIRSPVRKTYDIQEMSSENEKPSDMSIQEEVEEKASTKAKKRIYSPSSNSKVSVASADVTPKPISKMQKISNSPKVYKPTDETPNMPAEKDITENSKPVIESPKPKHEKKVSPRKKDKKPGTNITVQQLITDYTVESGLNQDIVDKQLINALNPRSESSNEPASQSDVLECNSLEVVSSFTSSKNLIAVKNVLSSSMTQFQQASGVQSKGSRLDWHPELISALSSNVSDSDSGVNVVAKIDMLPFMGSHECEWESSSGDTWTFRLLHGRLRLTARLAHRHDNAARSRVRGDTPVLEVTVETVQHDRKNPVATMCVRFACETMRYMVSRACRGGTCLASDIPPLLRRCAAVARVALRWGRAMHDAKLHLAYTLDNDGYLTLKVANIPLRSVWEVTMRVELVVDDAREAPWPRAGDVRVTRVVSDVSVPDAHVRRALAHTPRDWGHAPRTICVADVSVPDAHVRRALAHTPRDWGHAPRTIWYVSQRGRRQRARRARAPRARAHAARLGARAQDYLVCIAAWPTSACPTRTCAARSRTRRATGGTRPGLSGMYRSVADVSVPDAHVRRALAHTPRDWGHAPRTIWYVSQRGRRQRARRARAPRARAHAARLGARAQDYLVCIAAWPTSACPTRTCAARSRTRRATGGTRPGLSGMYRSVADVSVPDAHVRRALAHTPRDWGHAPRTIWYVSQRGRRQRARRARAPRARAHAARLGARAQDYLVCIAAWPTSACPTRTCAARSRTRRATGGTRPGLSGMYRSVADVSVPDAHVRRALAHTPRDWGHAPRTIWYVSQRGRRQRARRARAPRARAHAARLGARAQDYLVCIAAWPTSACPTRTCAARSRTRRATGGTRPGLSGMYRSVADVSVPDAHVRRALAHTPRDWGHAPRTIWYVSQRGRRQRARRARAPRARAHAARLGARAQDYLVCIAAWPTSACPTRTCAARSRTRRATGGTRPGLSGMYRSVADVSVPDAHVRRALAHTPRDWGHAPRTIWYVSQRGRRQRARRARAPRARAHAARLGARAQDYLVCIAAWPTSACPTRTCAARSRTRRATGGTRPGLSGMYRSVADVSVPDAHVRRALAHTPRDWGHAPRTIWYVSQRGRRQRARRARAPRARAHAARLGARAQDYLVCIAAWPTSACPTRTCAARSRTRRATGGTRPGLSGMYRSVADVSVPDAHVRRALAHTPRDWGHAPRTIWYVSQRGRRQRARRARAPRARAHAARLGARAQDYLVCIAAWPTSACPTRTCAARSRTRRATGGTRPGLSGMYRSVADVSVPDAHVRRALAHTPRDWGHAPRTIWYVSQRGRRQRARRARAPRARAHAARLGARAQDYLVCIAAWPTSACPTRTCAARSRTRRATGGTRPGLSGMYRSVADVSVPDAHVRRALAHTPRDWGHAPRTIWYVSQRGRRQRARRARAPRARAHAARLGARAQDYLVCIAAWPTSACPTRTCAARSRTRRATGGTRPGLSGMYRSVADVSVPDAHVRRALAHTPRDWGHAPRTIWRMFRYLKHKTRDDDILLS
uniref:Uncharacterized protein n=1 Tax=Heliothis virescens TaxID=7102 RepID=A0A2A4IXY2_HELVI